MHKLMGSLTQTGLLHLGSEVFSRGAVEEALTLISSTSPSYILLSSLDSARRQLYFHGEEMFTQAAELGSFLREGFGVRSGLKIMTAAQLPSGYGLDPTKVVVSLTAAGWSGLDAEEILRQKYGVQAEYADRDYLYFFISYAQKKGEVTALGEALLALADTPGPERGSQQSTPPPWAEAPLRLSPRVATEQPAVYLSIAEAAGQIAAGWVGAYPPGIPLWVPGEEITRSMLEWLTAFLDHGGYVRGLQQGKVKVISE
jgi:arginine/lysine/ornithine decarboxylase